MTAKTELAGRLLDNEAVDRFAAAMKSKLEYERVACARYGWDDPEVCTVEYLADQLVKHIAKGNAGTFEDVANFAMMLHQRGADPQVLSAALTAPPARAEVERLRAALTEAGTGEAEPVAWRFYCSFCDLKFNSLQCPSCGSVNGAANNYVSLASPPPVQPVVMARVRHKKRGTEYEVLGVGKMQAKNWGKRIDGVGYSSVDMREVVIYRSVDDGSLWVRPREEFEDGRFEARTAPPSEDDDNYHRSIEDEIAALSDPGQLGEGEWEPDDLRAEAVRLRQRAKALEALELHTNWELDWGERDPNWEGGECGWRVHECTGNRNDREWRLIGFGSTPSEALARALLDKPGGEPTQEPKS